MYFMSACVRVVTSANIERNVSMELKLLWASYIIIHKNFVEIKKHELQRVQSQCNTHINKTNEKRKKNAKNKYWSSYMECLRCKWSGIEQTNDVLIATPVQFSIFFFFLLRCWTNMRNSHTNQTFDWSGLFDIFCLTNWNWLYTQVDWLIASIISISKIEETHNAFIIPFIILFLWLFLCIILLDLPIVYYMFRFILLLLLIPAFHENISYLCMCFFRFNLLGFYRLFHFVVLSFCSLILLNIYFFFISLELYVHLYLYFMFIFAHVSKYLCV